MTLRADSPIHGFVPDGPTLLAAVFGGIQGGILQTEYQLGADYGKHTYMKVPISTSRLLIRKFRLADAGQMHSIENDEIVKEHLGGSTGKSLAGEGLVAA
jgi:hypothetical protein